MIHYWECKRCTSEWQTCCGGHMFQTPEQRALDRRKPYDLCDRCFLELEASDDLILRVLSLRNKLESTNHDLRKVINHLTAELGLGYDHNRTRNKVASIVADALA